MNHFYVICNSPAIQILFQNVCADEDGVKEYTFRNDFLTIDNLIVIVYPHSKFITKYRFEPFAKG